MLKKMKHKLLSLAMTVAMVTTLFAGMTISASAAWTGNINTTWYDPSSSVTSYTLSDGADLAGFAAIVNGNTSVLNNANYLDANGNQITARDDFAGKTVTLSNDTTVDFNLNNVAWTPIGGACAENSGYIPNGNAFAGTFDGQGNTISNLNINTTVTTGSSGNFAGYGLFGYVTGTIQNVSVKGSITLTGAAEYVGGVVGYTSGSVFNCYTEVTITANSASNVGGVVGAIESTETSALSTPLKVQYCSAINDITAGKRVGGLVGGEYCKYAGNVVVDNCSYTNGKITTKVTNSKVWSGGLVGYCKGYISNSYTNDITLAVSGGRYLSGFVGILNGSGPQAGVFNCYSNATYTGTAYNYDRPFVGSVDNSNSVPIVNCAWVNGQTSSSFTQPGATGNNGWGNYYNSASKAISNSRAAFSIVNKNLDQFILKNATTILKWQASGYTGTLDFTYLPNYSSLMTARTDNDATVFGSTNMIYLDTSATSNGTGTQSSPYNALDSAISAASGKTIVVRNPVAITASKSISASSTTNAITFARSTILDGPLFNVTDGTLTLGSNITLDGTASSFTGDPVSSLVIANGSSAGVAITGATLQNNYAGTGGGIWLLDGAASTMSSGSITGCTAVRNGGAVTLSSGSSFTMTGGTISGDSAAKGSAVFVGPNCTFNYAGSGIASDQVVYLANTSGNSDAYITLTGTSLSSLTVQCAHPTVDTNTPSNSTKIATAATDLSSSFAYVNNSYGFTSDFDYTTLNYNILLTTYGAS